MRIYAKLIILLLTFCFGSVLGNQYNIRLIEIPSEIGAGTRGASLGVGAIKTAALNKGSLYFKKYSSFKIKTENESLLEPVAYPYAKRISSMISIYDRLSNAIKKLLVDEHPFLIVLAGDHSTAGATIAGLKMAYPQKRLGVIWIDAHADIHTPYTSPSGNLHGMPVATAIAVDNKEQQVHVLDKKTAMMWEKLKRMGGIYSKVHTDDLVYIAVRDTETQEDYLLRKKRIKNYTVKEIREKGTRQIAREALERLSQCDLIYVSFDVDSMDSGLTCGTGAPVPNGITDTEAENILLELMKSNKVCCFEIAEINPTLDDGNTMGEISFNILDKVTDQVEKRLNLENAVDHEKRSARF